MTDPVLVEAWRGSRVESRHRGSVAVADSDGAIVLALGDIGQVVYPRSAVKVLQALPLVESGAAAHYGFGDEELALACASHGGEPGHTAVAAGMLARAGLDARALECGAHWPSHQPAALALARVGEGATPLHNNCSGKHAGFICAACQMNVEPRGYIDPLHPVQREVKAGFELLAGVRLPDNPAVDGCSAPNWPLSLSALARAFARIGTAQGLGTERAKATARLRAACAAQPWFVAGTGRFCTAVMEHFRARVFVKTGAEGVFCGTLPELGLGIALKCEDGAKRAAEVMMASVIARLLPLSDADRTMLDPLVRPALRNWNRTLVGHLQPAAELVADV